MKHVSEKEIAFFALDEAPDGAIASHLADCAACRLRFDAYQATIRRVVSAERLPDRGESYGREVWQRIARRIPPRPARKPAAPWRELFAPRRLAFAGVLSLVLAATFLAGRFWRVEQPAPLSSSVKERILVVALGEHLERSQAVLIELSNTPESGELDVSAEQSRASELVAANRLYRQTASREGDKAVASVLEELERVLLEVAHGPSRLSTEDLAALRQRIEGQGVLFKVRVIGSNLRERGDLLSAEALERKKT